MRPASYQAAAARELIHFAGEHAGAVNHKNRLFAVHYAGKLDAAVQYNEYAMLRIAQVEDDLTRGHAPFLAQRDQARNLRGVQLREHRIGRFHRFRHR